MSETLLAAMRRSSSAEEFVERFLLPAYKSGRLPSSRALRSRMSKKAPTNSRMDEFLHGMGEGKYSLIVFEDEKTGRLCRFKLEEGKPNLFPTRGMINFRPGFKTDSRDFKEAAIVTGKESFQRNSGIISIGLKIPPSIISHWRLKRPPEGRGGESVINVLLSNAVFNKLNHEDAGQQMAKSYLDVLKYLEGSIQLGILRRRIRSPNVAQDRGPYLAFYALYRKHSDMFLAISKAKSSREVASLLVSHLEIGKGAARFYGNKIMIRLSAHRGMEAATSIAKHSKLPLSEIPAYPKGR
ncbi:MAG: hypothetical protein ABH863_04960 [Candidatus Micrarchaeota archaeon]